MTCTAVFSAEHWIYGEQNSGHSFSHFLLYLFSSELLASLLEAQLAIPESFCRATFFSSSIWLSNRWSRHCTNENLPLGLFILKLLWIWLLHFLLICYLKLEIFFFTHLNPAQFWCVWTSLKDCYKLKTAYAQLYDSCFSSHSSLPTIMLFWFMKPF